MIEKKLMSVQETAKYLGVGKARIYKFCNMPDFPSLQIGRKFLIDKEQLDLWISDKIRLGGI